MKTLKEIYFKEAKVDEPQDGPLGKVVFASYRKDNVEQEPETDFEQDFFRALANHYYGDKTLNNIAPKILSLINSGKYQILSAPKNKDVYRGFDNIPIKIITNIIGISTKELLKSKNSGKGMYFSTKHTLNPKEDEIQSWSLNSNTAVRFALGDPIKSIENLEPNKASLVLISNTSLNNSFFLNPEFQKKIGYIDFQNFVKEKEILSYGSIKLKAVAIVANNSKNDLKGSIVKKELKKALKS